VLDFSPFCDTGQSVRERRRKVDLSSAGEVVRLVKFYFSVEVITGLLVPQKYRTKNRTKIWKIQDNLQDISRHRDIHSACAS